jgi:hypothetical protein
MVGCYSSSLSLKINVCGKAAMKTDVKSPPSVLVITSYMPKRGEVSSRSGGLSSVTHNSRLFSKELSRPVIMIIVAVFCYMGLGGCGSHVTRFPFEKIPYGSAPKVSDVGAVRKTLGKPLIASRYWGFELFREDRSQTEIAFMFFIPFMYDKDDIYRYTLISYNKDQIAESIVTGIHRSASKYWEISPTIKKDYLELYLQAGDFTFVSKWGDHETLMVTPARRDVYLERARFSSQCTAVIGCGKRGCSDTLRVDEGPSLPLPARLGVIEDHTYHTCDTVAALSLAPGKHTLKTWACLLCRGQTIAFSCREGEILYVVIDVDVSAKEERSWWLGAGAGVVWKFDLLKDMPEFFVDRPLLLYRGQWLVEPEPEN